MREEREVGVRGFEGDKGEDRRSRSRRTLCTTRIDQFRWPVRTDKSE